jgi:uncharacterized protein (DUF2225 family)
MSSRGYYRNSLKAWRDDLLKQRREGMARYARMEKMGHPDKNDQGILLDINRQLIEVIEAAQRVADALGPPNSSKAG